MDEIKHSPLQHCWIFSYSYYSSPFTPIDIYFEDNYCGDAQIDSFAMCILDAKYMENSTSTMLLLNNITSHLTSIKIYSMYYLNTKDYLMDPLESILTKRFTLTSNLEPSRFITMLILYFMYTNKLSKRSSTTCWTWYLTHLGPLNGRPLPLLFLNKIGRFVNSLIYAPLTKQLYTNNIPYLSSQTW